MASVSQIARAGFTLVEGVVSLAILTGALVGVWGLYASVLRSGSYSEKLTFATGLAQEKADELLSLPVDEAASGSDSVGIFARRWVVQPGTAAGTLEIDVLVSWARVDSRTSSLRVVTMRN
jgi:Tfp pilus assembly protein PilV